MAAKDLKERVKRKPPAYRPQSGERPAVVPPEQPAGQSDGATERPNPSWRPFSSAPPQSFPRAPQVTYPPERRDTWVDSPRESSGFYSCTDEQIESVSLPRPPRIPRVLGTAEPGRPVPGVSAGRAGATSTRQRGEYRPRVFISARLRRRADEWLATGSLTLPAAWSARHARAMQRGLLLALLMEPGWEVLPDGMQQRAAWLFREGWAEGTSRRDADDVMTLLQLPPTRDARGLLVRAVDAAFPEGVRQPPSTSKRPSQRPPSTPPPSVRPPSVPPQAVWSWPSSSDD